MSSKTHTNTKGLANVRDLVDGGRAERKERERNVFPFFVLVVVVFVCLFILQGRVSLCSSGCSRTHSVDQAGLELTVILCLPSAWIKGVRHH